MPPTSAERGQESRTKLLEAAAQLIVEEGWGGVTTRKVADRAGLRSGLVHYHFPSVDDLLIDAALTAVHQETAVVAAAMESAADPGAGLVQLLDRIGSYTSDDPSTVLFSEMLLASTRHPRLRSELSVLLAEWRAHAAGWLTASGCTSGDNEANALLLGAVVDGLVLHLLVDPSLSGVDVVAPLRRMLGLRAPEAGPTAEAQKVPEIPEAPA